MGEHLQLINIPIIEESGIYSIDLNKPYFGILDAEFQVEMEITHERIPNTDEEKIVRVNVSACCLDPFLDDSNAYALERQLIDYIKYSIELPY